LSPVPEVKCSAASQKPAERTAKRIGPAAERE
jgi:hypothetical protein